jgi:hypothetical protein
MASMRELTLEAPLPDSVLPYPKGLWNRTKYVFWKSITPGYTWGRHTLENLGVIHHEGRQRYVIGTLREDRTLADFLHYIEAGGFANHFIAWDDDDQIVSVRKLVDFEWQYHLRIFKDGEVRGHFEYTPESHPLWHLKEKNMQQRSDEFLDFVGDWVVRD